MTLDALYAHLHRRAQATGQHQHADLRGGARLAVAVDGAWTAVTFSRKGKPLRDTEIVVFRRCCGVPATALRNPLDGQRQHEHDGAQWHAVSYRWKEQP